MTSDNGPRTTDYGLQPLDTLMTTLNLKNTDLVRHSTEQLTHKQVAKARLGRPLTFNIKMKILNAFNAFAGENKYKPTDLFNY